MAQYFMLILAFIFAFGISIQGLMYINQPASSNMLRNVFFKPLFVTGGDLYYRDNIYGAGISLYGLSPNKLP